MVIEAPLLLKPVEVIEVKRWEEPETKAYQKEYHKSYYEENKEELKANRRTKFAENGKQYYQDNKDKIKARMKAYYIRKKARLAHEKLEQACQV